MPVAFCLTECEFYPVAGSKLRHEALGRFQKAVNSGPTDCHFNPLLVNLLFWKLFPCLVLIRPLSRPFTFVIKDSFYIPSYFSINKFIIRILPIQPQNTSICRSLSLSLNSYGPNLSSFFAIPKYLR